MSQQNWCPLCAAPMVTYHNVPGTTTGNLCKCTNPNCEYTTGDLDHRLGILPNDSVLRCPHCHYVHGMDTTGGDPRCPQCGGRLRATAVGGGWQPSVGAVAPSPLRRQLASPNAEIDRVWLKFDVVRNGRKGMEFHIHFHITNYMGKSGQVCVFVYEKDGDPVRNDGEDHYITPSGFLTVQEEFTPRYDQAVYEDFCLFLPYDQFYKGSHSYYTEVQIHGDSKSLDQETTGGFEVRRRS